MTARGIDRMLADPALVATIGARFWNLVNIPPDRTGCWLWTGTGRGQHDYGSFKIFSYVTIAAHRVSYALATGENPGEALVLHRCDTPRCVNPDHLFLGSHEDNMADMVAKGRANTESRPGERNPRAKLTEAQALGIIAEIATGKNNKQIAAMFGVSHGTVSNIRLNKSWKHLPRDRKFSRYGSLRIEPSTT